VAVEIAIQLTNSSIRQLGHMGACVPSGHMGFMVDEVALFSPANYNITNFIILV
jgi:hypothetical protein